MRLLLVLFCLGASSLFAQAPDTLWTRRYGGFASDFGRGVIELSSGGYVIVGSTYSIGVNGDIYIVKTNTSGIALWSRNVGGSSFDEGFDAVETHDNGIVVVGYTSSFDVGETGVYVMKLSASGDTLWTRIIDGIYADQGYSITSSSDSGFVMVGYSNSNLVSTDAYLVKVDRTGQLVWSKFIGRNGIEVGNCVESTSDNGFIIAGRTNSFGAGDDDFFLVKTNSLGDTMWMRAYGGPGTERAYSVQQTQDNGFILAGYTTSFGSGDIDLYVVKTDSLGSVMWSRAYGYGGWWEGLEWAGIQETINGGYLLTGEIVYNGFVPADFLAIKLSSIGDTLGSRRYGGEQDERVYALKRTSDTGFIMVGNTHSFGAGQGDIYAIKTVPQRLLSVSEPNGGDTWRMGLTDSLKWTSFDYFGPVAIFLNRHYPVGAWEVITDSTENDGEYEWFVTDPLSDSCRIRVCAVEDTFCDISDGNFSITSSQGYLGLVRTVAPNSPVLAWNTGMVECPAMASETFRLKNFGSEAIVVFQPLEPATAEFSRTTSCGSFFALAPGQMSSCSLRLAYSPIAEGEDQDTLRVQTDAMNGTGGYVKIPLQGAQSRTPETPQIVILPQGINARLSWDAIIESVGGCAVDVTAYLVFYSQFSGGPYFFHGFTTDTTYVHSGVLHFAPAMYYEVMATTEELPAVMRILPNSERSVALRMIEE